MYKLYELFDIVRIRNIFGRTFFLLFVTIIFNCCIKLKVIDPPPYADTEITFTGYLTNAFNTVSGHTYVSYTITYTSVWVSFDGSVGTEHEIVKKTLTISSSTGVPQAVITMKIPNDNKTYFRIRCTVVATQCSRAALADNCIQIPDGTGGYLAGKPQYVYQSFDLNRYFSTGAVSSFVQFPNAYCGCDVPH
jgi:hypothetical protein